MQEYPIFIFAALLTLIYGFFSKLSERSPVSAAMVFVFRRHPGWSAGI